MGEISVDLIRITESGVCKDIVYFQVVTFFLILGIDVILWWGVEAASPRRSSLGGFRKIC